MRIHGLYLILCQTRDRLHLFRHLVQQLRRKLRVDDLTQEPSVVIAVDVHHILHQFEGVGKQIPLFIHDELIIAHTGVGLRDGHILIELITVLILHNDLHRVVARADANSLHLHLHVLIDHHFLIAITFDFRINTIELCLGIDILPDQFLTGYIHIPQIGQRGYTQFAEAVVIERTIRNLIIIRPLVVLAEEIDMGTSIRILLMSLIDHDLMTQRDTAHRFVCGSIIESLHHHIILLRDYHELHALLPVAETVELEVLTDEIDGVLFLLIFIIHQLQIRNMLSPTCFHDVGILLSIGRRQEECCTGR